MTKATEMSITTADIERIRARSRQREEKEHRASAVHYDETQRRLHIETFKGAVFSVDADMLQGVAGASDAQVSNIEILPSGEALHWPDLDASLLVHGICTGVYGSKRWMESLVTVCD